MNKAGELYAALGGYKTHYVAGAKTRDQNGDFVIGDIMVSPGIGGLVRDEDKVVRITVPWHSIFNFSVIHEELQLIEEPGLVLPEGMTQ